MGTARVLCAAGLLASLTLSAPPPLRAETPIPAAPARWVTDNAGLLSAQQRASLDARLAAYQRQTGHQVLVYLDRSTGGVPIEDWAVRAFQSWRVGRKGIDDGAVLFLFNDDRRVRIEVGYGLESQVPDARAAGIIRELIVPRLRLGDAPGAIVAGVGALLKTIGGEAPGQPADHTLAPQPPPPLPWWAIVAGGLVIVVVLMGLATHPALAAWLLYSIASGRGAGRGGGGWGDSSGFGGGGGGGGFSGGGGRSGGGGASGSW